MCGASLVNPLRVLGNALRMSAVERYGRGHGTPGMEFHAFGRSIGSRLLRRGVPEGLVYWMAPVAMFRYFEFAFAWAHLPREPGHFLDVSSPRLLSLYAAWQRPEASIQMINPDPKDALRTHRALAGLGLRNVKIDQRGVESIGRGEGPYDCIWSISVVEHIHGDLDDRAAVQRMIDSLGPGRRLILTVPVDRHYHEDYRNRETYRLGAKPSSGGRFFFERVYDRATLWERLVAPTGLQPSALRWFGEVEPGRYSAYEARWIREGWPMNITDAIEIADHYREFSSWEEMPGLGVCGLMLEIGGATAGGATS